MSIKLVTEVSMAIDGKRDLWLITTAEKVEEENIEEVVESMANAMLTQAMKAVELTSSAAAPSEPRMPRTFQEDDE